MSTYVGRSHISLLMAAAMAGLGSWPLVARPDDGRPLRSAGKQSRVRATPRFSSNKPHQGKREIARRRVQMLRIELDKCCKEGLKMSWNDQVDLGYVDAAEDLLRQIMALMPFAYGRKTLTAPRRVWILTDIFGRPFECPKRGPLARLRFARMGCQIVLSGGAA